jgi:hypothetical protein
MRMKHCKIKHPRDFFLKGGGHVTSAAILDFRIFPEKSEEKKDIKKFVNVKIIFSTEIHGQTSQ